MNCSHGIPEERYCEQCAYTPQAHIKNLETELATKTAEIVELEGLVREMGQILKAALSLTNAASDWALRYKIDALDEEALTVNAMFFEKDNDGILFHPKVQSIMEKKP